MPMLGGYIGPISYIPLVNMLGREEVKPQKRKPGQGIPGTKHAGYRKQNVGLDRKIWGFICGSEKIG